jgi:hypothetical protein
MDGGSCVGKLSNGELTSSSGGKGDENVSLTVGLGHVHQANLR